MQFESRARVPAIDPSAYVAPTATVVGDVRIGAHSRVMHGAVLIAEGGGAIELGDYVIVLENAVIRSTALHSVTVGSHCLVGPHAHLAGCTLEPEVFVATGASVFHGAVLGRGSEVRINAVVHLRSRLASGATVPIGWVAAGDPAQILPPHEHEKIWAIQKPLNFPLTVYGLDRSEASMPRITEQMSRWLGAHRDDRAV